MTIDEDKPEQWLGVGAGGRNIGKFKPEHLGRVVYPYTDRAAASDPRPLEPAPHEAEEIKAVLDQLLGEGTYAPGIAAGPEQGVLARGGVRGDAISSLCKTLYISFVILY
jgi:hypothetical protein